MEGEYHFNEFHCSARRATCVKISSCEEMRSKALQSSSRKFSVLDSLQKKNPRRMLRADSSFAYDKQEIKKNKEETKIGTCLKKELSASLSPSPFKETEMKDSELEEMVSSNKVLFTPFFTSGQSPMQSLKKKAMQDHILHALQSVCIIKKLEPISESDIEKHKVVLPPLPLSKNLISFLIFLR